MEGITIKTKGMHCPSCEMLVKDSLEDLEGVQKAEASHKTGDISVVFDDQITNLKEIKQTIKEEGYEAVEE